MGTQHNGRPLNPTKSYSRPGSGQGERVNADEVAGVPKKLGDLTDVDPSVTASLGSILVGDGSVFQEFPAGADGEILQYDSAEPLGVKSVAITSGGSGILTFGADSVGSSTTTRYLFAGYAESIAEIGPHFAPVPKAGTLRNLHIRHGILGGSSALIVYRVRVNEVATPLLVSLAADGASASNGVDTVAVVAGDRVDLQVVKTVGIGASPRNVVAAMEVA